MNFWEKLLKPFSVLAPMEDVTDVVFRQMMVKFGRPDVFFTEFVNTDGLSSEKGFLAVSHRLKFFSNEKPIVAQIWGTKPENFFASAKIVKDLGFDGVDINMGCPQKKIIKNGACSALIKNPNLAKEIIIATREGAGDLPVSVKTRIGFNKIITEEWIGFLLDQNLDALTIHGRTQKEMSAVSAHWDEIGKAVDLKNTKVKSQKSKEKIFKTNKTSLSTSSLSNDKNKNTIIIGNGDVEKFSEIRKKHELYGVDGVMVGRGVFKNPWIFSGKNMDEISVQEKLQFLIEHIEFFVETWKIDKGESQCVSTEKYYKNFSIMKKFFKIYINGWNGASEFREKLNGLKTSKEIIFEVKNLLEKIK
ncbi:MAG: tRNA-dihydrouridine synthase [Patescibacteria group bacterium]